jgi:hypothetical protein
MSDTGDIFTEDEYRDYLDRYFEGNEGDLEKEFDVIKRGDGTRRLIRIPEARKNKFEKKLNKAVVGVNTLRTPWNIAKKSKTGMAIFFIILALAPGSFNVKSIIIGVIVLVTFGVKSVKLGHDLFKNKNAAILWIGTIAMLFPLLGISSEGGYIWTILIMVVFLMTIFTKGKKQGVALIIAVIFGITEFFGGGKKWSIMIIAGLIIFSIAKINKKRGAAIKSAGSLMKGDKEAKDKDKRRKDLDKRFAEEGVEYEETDDGGARLSNISGFLEMVETKKQEMIDEIETLENAEAGLIQELQDDELLRIIRQAGGWRNYVQNVLPKLMDSRSDEYEKLAQGESHVMKLISMIAVIMKKVGEFNTFEVELTNRLNVDSNDKVIIGCMKEHSEAAAEIRDALGRIYESTIIVINEINRIIIELRGMDVAAERLEEELDPRNVMQRIKEEWSKIEIENEQQLNELIRVETQHLNELKQEIEVELSLVNYLKAEIMDLEERKRQGMEGYSRQVRRGTDIKLNGHYKDSKWELEHEDGQA